MQSAGLGDFRPAPIREPPQPDRLAGQNTAELVTLRRVAREVRDIAADIDPDEDDRPEQGPVPAYLRGDFDDNLAEHIPPDELARIANDLLQGIEADLQSRQDWEKIVVNAIEYCGLIYEEASGQVSPGGSISKVWHTLICEAALQFWANAHAEFLPSDGPVKVRDDKPPVAKPPRAAGIGDNGGPPLDADPEDSDRDVRAEALEIDMNHYLTVGDRQYYSDFSRMLFSLGPIGTQFRKVYFNPLRRMPVSEWVKAENLIVSNDAVHLATANRVTERIMMSQGDVKRLQIMGWWLNQPLSMPVDQPTTVEQTIGQVEGIKPGTSLPHDYRHTTYECSTELDLPGFRHTDEDDTETGLPLPYRMALDKDSRRIHAIHRNWREGDENFDTRQRYVMFGLVPGFGFYYLGYAHILGNSERALTTLEREIIDKGMLSIFPGFVNAKGALKNTTQIRVPPGGTVEVELNGRQSIKDVLMEIPYTDLPQSILALMEKLEGNARKLVSMIELPVGDGTANIPVGTMVAMIEESGKLTAAVHRGLHDSRSEELELLKELLAEDPTMLMRGNKSPARQWQAAEELADLDLVPASDPNTPSHIHRVMRAVAGAQLTQMFPDLADRRAFFKELLTIIRWPNPEDYILPEGAGPPQQPSPQALAAQAKVQTATIQAQSRATETAAKLQGQAADRASKERVALLDSHDDQVKAAADAQSDAARMHDSAAERAQDAALAGTQRAHDMAKTEREHLHRGGVAHEDRVHEMDQAERERQHAAEQAERDREHERQMANTFPRTTPPRAF